MPAPAHALATPSILIEERWPLVWVHVVSKPTDEEVEFLLSEYERFIATQANYGIAINTAPGVRQTHAQNRRTGDWMKQNRAAYEGRLRCLAFVSTSPMMRFALSMVFLIQPLTVPYSVVASEDEAEAFLRRHTSAIEG